MRVISTEQAELVAKRVAAEVRAEMGRQGLSQQALADRLGWLQSRLSRRLSDGKNPLIPFDVIELDTVSQALGVPLSRLLSTEHAYAVTSAA